MATALSDRINTIEQFLLAAGTAKVMIAATTSDIIKNLSIHHIQASMNAIESSMDDINEYVDIVSTKIDPEVFDDELESFLNEDLETLPDVPTHLVKSTVSVPNPESIIHSQSKLKIIMI